MLFINVGLWIVLLNDNLLSLSINNGDNDDLNSISKSTFISPWLTILFHKISIENIVWYTGKKTFICIIKNVFLAIYNTINESVIY